MMNLAEYRSKSACLADFLPWVALVGEGVVLNKDGSLQRTARFRGPDLDSATPAELVAVTSRLNNALRRLGSGWAAFVEADRLPASDYPQSDFPDPASALVDMERREQFREEGAHFESRYFLTLLWMPPAEDASRAEGWLYEGMARSGVDPREHIASFTDRTNRVLHLVEGFMPEAEWLDDAETLTFLHSTVSTNRQRVRVPETPVYLDALLTDERLIGEQRIERSLPGLVEGQPTRQGVARLFGDADRRPRGWRGHPLALRVAHVTAVRGEVGAIVSRAKAAKAGPVGRGHAQGIGAPAAAQPVGEGRA